MPNSNNTILNRSQSFMFLYRALAVTLSALNSDSDDDNIDGSQPKRQQTIKSRFTREDQDNSVFSVLYIKSFDDRNNNNNENDNNVIVLMDDTNNKAIAFWNNFCVLYVAFLPICELFQEVKHKGGCHRLSYC